MNIKDIRHFKLLLINYHFNKKKSNLPFDVQINESNYILHLWTMDDDLYESACNVKIDDYIAISVPIIKPVMTLKWTKAKV